MNVTLIDLWDIDKKSNFVTKVATKILFTLLTKKDPVFGEKAV